VLSLVDPEARHGHKTSAHGFDGYKSLFHKGPMRWAGRRP
jgi:hypothetical protein